MTEINLLFRKEGHPKEGEFVLCEVNNISKNSVFVTLVEYANYKGIIPIYEIAPGRIRNIRKYVKEGKVIVCKVLNVDTLRRHVALSLRRVSERETKEKISWLKQEQDAEKVLELVSERTSYDLHKLFKELIKALPQKYDHLYDFFQDVSSGDVNLNVNLPKKVENELLNLIKDRIKPKEVTLVARILLKSTLSDGVEIIRSTFTTLKSKYKKKNISFHYLGRGHYSIKVISKDAKSADNVLKEILNDLEKLVDDKVEYDFIEKTLKK